MRRCGFLDTMLNSINGRGYTSAPNPLCNSDWKRSPDLREMLDTLRPHWENSNALISTPIATDYWETFCFSAADVAELGKLSPDSPRKRAYFDRRDSSERRRNGGT